MPEATIARPAVSSELAAAASDLLFRLADDCLVLGHRNSEWTGLGPILEADIALSSMAQDEIGHAQAYYRMLESLGHGDPDSLAFGRPIERFRCASLVCLPRGDWARAVVRQYLFDAALAVRLESLVSCAFEPLAALSRKVRGEHKYHLLHGRTWLQRLGRATDESRSRMQTAVDELFAHALGLFEPTAQDAAIARLGVQAAEADLVAPWRRSVEPQLAEAGLSVPRSATPIYGGRAGKHPPELAELLGALRKVYALDPAAKW